MSVYRAINAVQTDLAKIGIGKDRNNAQQGYKFRGIDDVYNALAPLLAKHGLCILPRLTARSVTERVSAKGAALFYIDVTMEFDFVSSEDGSKHTVVTAGEAMDSGDKATNKAMSAAYKYACMQAFSIPTEGDNDTENHTYEVKAKRINPVKNAINPDIDGDALEQWMREHPDETISLQDLANELIDLIERQNEPRIAFLKYDDQGLDSEQQLVLAGILGPHSKTRNTLKEQILIDRKAKRELPVS